MNYPNLTIENSVSDFVNKNPDPAIEIFTKLDIDFFCCGGDVPLKVACEGKGLNLSHVLSQLNDPKRALQSLPNIL